MTGASPLTSIDEANQIILDQQDKIRALTIVANDARELAKQPCGHCARRMAAQSDWRDHGCARIATYVAAMLSLPVLVLIWAIIQ